MKMRSMHALRNHSVRKQQAVLGAKIDALSWDDAIENIVAAGAAHVSAYICICNVHVVVTGVRDPEFMHIINHADMATPDGAPIAWALRTLGFSRQERINGPDLMWKYLREAERIGHIVFFYGSTETTLEKLRTSLMHHFPHLRIGGLHAPPFRALTAHEDEIEIDLIHRCGAHIVFVGLGCPKQERWMAAHRGRVHAVMIGVGAAFDYHAGVIKRAPPWWQQHGLEWLYRLASEPRRLFKRYLVTNTVFMLGFAWQFIRQKILRRLLVKCPPKFK